MGKVAGLEKIVVNFVSVFFIVKGVDGFPLIRTSGCVCNDSNINFEEGFLLGD